MHCGQKFENQLCNTPSGARKTQVCCLPQFPSLPWYLYNPIPLTLHKDTKGSEASTLLYTTFPLPSVSTEPVGDRVFMKSE